ncbi:leucine-rich repeat-containing protein 61 isoform 1-T2 [Molossus nigricans]
MLEVEKIKKPPKRHASSGSVSPMTTPQSPAATVTSPGSRFNTRATNTRATNTSCGLGWGAREDLPETEVKLEFVDIEEKASSGRRKVRPSGSQKEGERDLPLQRKRSRPLPSDSSIPSPDQVFLEEQEEGALGLRVCSRKRRACSLGRPGFHSAASRAKSQASPGQSKPKGGSELCGVISGLGQELCVQPEKVSKQKARGRREVGQPAGKKARAPKRSSGPAPSTPGPVQAASLDRSEAGQPHGSAEASQADILIARLDREVRRLKKWKKRHLLPGVGEEKSLLSLQKPPCLKKLARTIEETEGWASQGRSPSPQDAIGQKPAPGVRRYFTIDCKNTCHVTCTLCHTGNRQGKIKGQAKTSDLVCPLGLLAQS